MDRKTLAYVLGGGAIAVGVGALLFWPRGKRVALVGDSLAVGLTAPLRALAAAHSVPFMAQGVVSTTPLQWATSATACGNCGAWMNAFSPTIILVVLGTNDIGYSPAPPVGSYRTLADRWGTIGRVVWVMPPTMPNDKLAGVRGVISGLGVTTLGPQQGLTFGSDGIHPTNYTPWAQSIAAAVF